MKLKNMSKEELELLSYTDLTNILLKEKGRPMNTPSIFKEICQLLEFTDEQYAEKIGDYYTSLTIDKRFVLLENHEWDLRERHAVELVIDDEEDEDIEVVEDDLEEEIDEEDEDVDAVIDDEDLEDVEDDIEDLSIVNDDESEDNL